MIVTDWPIRHSFDTYTARDAGITYDQRQREITHDAYRDQPTPRWFTATDEEMS